MLSEHKEELILQKNNIYSMHTNVNEEVLGMRFVSQELTPHKDIFSTSVALRTCFYWTV